MKPAQEEQALTAQTEKDIQAGLLNKQPLKKIAAGLLKKKAVLKNNSAFLNVCRFLYQAGLYKELLKAGRPSARGKLPLPWAFIIQILKDFRIQVSLKNQEVFLRGVKQQKQIQEILGCHVWDRRHPGLKSLKADRIKQINKQRNPDFVRLMDDLEFIQSQGVLKKEQEILKKLQIIEPKHPAVQEKWLAFKERWGRRIIQEKKQSFLKTPSPPAELSLEEQKSLQALLKPAKLLVKQNPAAAGNLALLFAFINQPRRAAELLENNLHSPAEEWLYADLLLQSRLYVACLDFTDYMEEKHKHDPNTVFALAYIRARAWAGLGKKQKAQNILEELAKIKPNYRLIHVLIAQWKKEEEH